MKKQQVSATWLFVLVASITSMSVRVAIAANQPAAKPNIVLFLVDDMGWMDSTPYGSQYHVN